MVSSATARATNVPATECTPTAEPGGAPRTLCEHGRGERMQNEKLEMQKESGLLLPILQF
jgi:hypothetical protein